MKGLLFCWLTCAALITLHAAPALPSFDFTQASVCAEWHAVHDISAMRYTPQGLEISISGSDPYLHGPARDFPANTPLQLLMRVKSDEGGLGQIFYFRGQPREVNSVRFPVKPGAWTDVRATLPALGPGYRLRLDPPGTGGKMIVASLSFAPAVSLTAPSWPKPEPIDFANASRLRSGSVELLVTKRGFALNVDGRRMAASHTHSLIGYVVGKQMRWLDLANPDVVSTQLEATPRSVRTLSTLHDEDGGTWKISQDFSVGATSGAISMQVTVETSREREVAFLPLLLLIANEGNTNKDQAVFPGLEYLANEPSSSEADLVGPKSKREVPANYKITFPLMAIQSYGRFVGLSWEPTPQFSALFDSPDRVLNTGGHVMGILFPGSDGYNRREGSLMPFTAQELPAGESLVLKAELIGGRGDSVVPAIQQYVRLRGLPPAPQTGYSFVDYVTLAAHGWLDSGIRQGDLFRHALASNFGPHPAADAALDMNWLSTQTKDPALNHRLVEAARGALAAVPADQYDSALIGHVRYPVQSLVYGHVVESIEQHRALAQSLLQRFNTDGTITLQPGPNGVDFARTHFARHANGLTAQVAANALDAAMFSGDRTLMDRAVGELRLLQKVYDHSVPRGAQTWEVPLHTPDILASAHLVRAFTMGYQLTGERTFLDEANYWAWTGLPFLYLINPIGSDDAPYGCVTVFGATHWKAPVWLGRPVQWCGLVYADALYRLAPFDPSGPWKQIADGITATGIRYSWPLTDKDRQGLLPDSWEILSLTRNAPPINPATVQANAVRFYGHTPLYDCRVFHLGSERLIAHAPGKIIPSKALDETVKFAVRAWPIAPYYVLINGLAGAPKVEVDGQVTPLTAPNQFLEKEGALILQLSGQPTVEIKSVAAPQY